MSWDILSGRSQKIKIDLNGRPKFVAKLKCDLMCFYLSIFHDRANTFLLLHKTFAGFSNTVSFC